MKKFLILNIIVLLFVSNILCLKSEALNYNLEISKIENNLFGYDYNNEKTQNRLMRLEKTLYGKVSSGDTEKRLKKIINDISANEIGLEITPTEDTFKYAEEIADSSVQYPIVDEIEKKLFNKVYNDRDFHTRIVTIERKLFGKIYDVEDYASRMERIKKEVLPQNVIAKNDEYNTNKPQIIDVPQEQVPYKPSQFSFGSWGFGNNTQFRNKLSDEELSRMEYETFGTEFSADDNITREKRLKSVHKAKKSSARYDSNNFQQKMSTAMEIGAMILMILAMVL